MTIYVEGGGSTRDLQASARRAFSTLCSNAGLSGRLPRIIACGGRGEAIHDFKVAVRRGEAAALLVDSERPVAQGASAAAHLHGRDEWPSLADDARLHLMVQVMESWLLTQPDVVSAYFGSGFKIKALPSAQNLESCAKAKVLDGLDRATAQCTSGASTNGKRKGFDVLERLSPGPIEASSPFARRFFEYLRQHC